MFPMFRPSGSKRESWRDFRFEGAIFDLDGVLVDTAKYHYLAWQWMAGELGFDFTEADNERLKGVSRIRSLEILLEIGGVSLTEEERQAWAYKKNERYVAHISRMDETELLPGAKAYLTELKSRSIRIALGSASKNAGLILERTGIASCFDVIVDGNRVSASKPDPEVFLTACRELGLPPSACVVFEDAESGVEAARRAGIPVVGIGSPEVLKKADWILAGLGQMMSPQE
jgi:beta-phosphoglucomutase